VRYRNTFCVWLTGLSGAGKSTLADALARRLAGQGVSVEIFDGDAVRSRMSTDLGFSRADRNENVARVAARAAAVLDQSRVAICALMSPYAAGRQRAREIIGADRFVLVHMATPLPVCETRDSKGLYARARRGEIRHFVGIDEEYEVPQDADLVLDTTSSSVDLDVARVLDVLSRYEPISDGRPAPVSRARA
jgi:adenylyl-sulfate kinase